MALLRTGYFGAPSRLSSCSVGQRRATTVKRFVLLTHRMMNSMEESISFALATCSLVSVYQPSDKLYELVGDSSRLSRWIN